jgi:dihydrofolate synthase/folylpolyglutamate synthase
VNLAVIETGLGGRLDATNTLKPLLSVITGISLEHKAHLGDTLAAVASEKCGIIKPGRPVVTGARSPEALAVIRDTAARLKAPLCVTADTVSVRLHQTSPAAQIVEAETASMSYGRLHLGLLGAHQRENLAVALAVLDILRDRYHLPVDIDAVRKGMKAVRWPGRFQMLETDPPVVLDGAHNPEAAAALAATLESVFKGRPVGLVAGLCDDKEADAFFGALRPLVKRTWTVRFGNERSCDPQTLRAAAARLGLAAETADLDRAVRAARSWARETGGAVCIAGSLFLAGDVLAMYAERQP